MKPAVRHLDATSEYYFEEGCFILELLNSADEPAISIARARVRPGEATAGHRLAGIDERYVILNGKGKVEIEGLPPETVLPGDVVQIPAGCAQRITNVSEVDLVFLAVCTPRFLPERFEPADM